jgi:ABC-type antimicrobial peptide transport system permease subunit
MIRMALGAQRHHIIQAIGIFGVSTGDAATFASMTVLLAMISVLAFVIPVRAATRLDAVEAIRRE